MKPGDIVVAWSDGIPKRIRRLEAIGTYPDGSPAYECGPVAPGFEGSVGCYFDHAELWTDQGRMR